jgi:CO dehydrogenase/acetyl-CoA synthase beta subunit
MARLIREIGESGRPVKEWSLSSVGTAPAAAPPFQVGPGAGSGLVLRSDTFAELGSPAVGSCAFALYTDSSSFVRDGRIRLVGPDIPESGSKTIPFGQVILAAGKNLDERDYRPLAESQYVGDRIEGFMVKSTPGRLWCRVSNDVAARGFDFRFLGSALIRLVKEQVPAAEAVEVIFVTSGREELRRMGEIESRASGVAREIKTRVWKEKGIDIDSCPLSGHCGACKDKEVCDEVKKMMHGRKGIS